MNSVQVSFPGLGISIDVSPVAISIGNFNIYWYGILIAAGMVLCGFLAVKQCKKNNFPDSLVYDVLLCDIPSAIIGARLYYVACEWGYYSQDLRRIFDTRSGGLAVYGGVLGAFLGVFIMCKIRKIPFTSIADYCVIYIPLGQAIGRWGNFFNQEAFGTTTTLPWGMTSPTVESYLASHCPTLVSTMPVHPTFLYESIADLAIFFLLLYVRKNSKFAFETACTYFATYGFVRFFLEGLRTDSLYIGSTGIRTSQALSLVLVVASLIYIAIAHLKQMGRLPFPARLYEEGTKKQVNG
ncbi:MAG: prolipoprotein diacylglyceryl transferase [Clostridiales bacterium]|nr:prolipoprotein diacylglyceryl transferase [Clostridiales bacterium]